MHTPAVDRSTLALAHGDVRLPAFLPDATHGVVRGLDAVDTASVGVQGLVMSVFHLMQRPGSSTIAALGGLHRMFGWPKPIVTDSGGFQIYSLIRQNPKMGSLSDRGLVYRPEGTRRRINLSPEKSIQLQMRYGADVVVCLDDCTDAGDSPEVQRESVRRTILWARRCKDEYNRLLAERGADGPPPLLMGVIQGGGLLPLRRACAEALLEIGFDAYGLGGWPLDAEGNLLTDVIAYLRELVPHRFPLHALGVGHPAYVTACARMGYDLFDSALPTRDARRGRLLAFAAPPGAGERFAYLYMQDERHLKDGRPLSEYCDCPVCQRYSRGYMHHLFKTGDTLFPRLATLHNLRFMIQLMERLRDERHARA